MSSARDNLNRWNTRNSRHRTKAPGGSIGKWNESGRDIFPEVRALMDQHDIKIPGNPKKFAGLSKAMQLDYVATRMIAQSRTTTKHTEMRAEGILSVSQFERRVSREVYSNYGTLNHPQAPEPTRGVFTRKHVMKKGIRHYDTEAAEIAPEVEPPVTVRKMLPEEYKK